MPGSVLGAWTLSVRRSDRNHCPQEPNALSGRRVQGLYSKGVCCDRGQGRIGEIGRAGFGRARLLFLSWGHLRTDLGQARELKGWVSGEECPRGRKVAADARDGRRAWVAEQRGGWGDGGWELRAVGAGR